MACTPKLPLTGLYSESYAGGSAAIAMSRAGFDAFPIKDASERPLWLEITSLFDTLIVCRFYRDLYLWEELKCQRRQADPPVDV